jgi:mono/diheme cytochrome c family protein
MAAPRRCRLPWLIAFAGCLLGSAAGTIRAGESADESIPFANVAPLFQKHCHTCHGPEKAEAKLRIDKLNPDFVKGNDGDHWRDVLDRLNFGDMPPAKAPPLKKEDRDLMTGWLTQEHRRAALAKNQAAHFRRLTRREYERTMQDLLGLPIEFASRLPEDGRSKDGFRNDGDALRMSPLQYELYLQIADDALAEAIVSGPIPAVHRYRLEAKKPAVVLPKPADRPGESYNYAAKGQGFTIGDECSSGKDQPLGTLLPAAPRPHGEAALARPEFRYGFRLHHPFRRGEALIRVRAARGELKPGEPKAGMESSRPPQLGLGLGCTNLHGVELKNVGDPVVIDHAEFRTYEFRVRHENFPLPNPGPFTDRNCSVLLVWNAAPKLSRQEKETNPPTLKIDWVEFESPYLEVWPPASHTKILFTNTGLSEPDYAREVVRRFASRAYREPVGKAELDRLMRFWATARKETDSLESSLRETLSLVLTSSRFLALPASRSGASGKERLTDHELAVRLSYLLWSTMPDETLVRLADQKKLSDAKVLPEQVRRMIQDPKAWMFIEQFAEQWLELDRLQRVTVHKDSYPDFDDRLAAAMRLETIHFFGEVLRGDLSIFEFLASDFTYVNDRLALHYGIAGVSGPGFRKVKLEGSRQRGGVLTHAGILTGLSDGRDGHPIKRGMWVLKNLLDEPPPPPPPNVPELDRNNPDIKKLTIPQALALHRKSTACVGCHQKIDPWGIAFEEYDALGNWQRDGVGATLRKRRTSQPIDARGELPTGVKVDGMRDLRAELLRSKSDSFRRALLRKVMAYALGRSLTLEDVGVADGLVPALRTREDQLSALIELIVASEPFQSK